MTLNKYMAMGPSGARFQVWACRLLAGSKLLLCSAIQLHILTIDLRLLTDWLTNDRPVLSSERAPSQGQDSNCQTVICGHEPQTGLDTKTDRLTDWPSVAMWLWLWLNSVSAVHFSGASWLVNEWVGGLLRFSPCELLLLEAGSWGRGIPGTQSQGNVRHCKPLPGNDRWRHGRLRRLSVSCN
jgi:hypothetical protein